MSPQQQSRTRAGHDPHPGGARTGGQEHLSDSNKGLARYRAKDTGFNQPGCVCACACVPVWEGAPMRSCVFPCVHVSLCGTMFPHVCSPTSPCVHVCAQTRVHMPTGAQGDEEAVASTHAGARLSLHPCAEEPDISLSKALQRAPFLLSVGSVGYSHQKSRSQCHKENNNKGSFPRKGLEDNSVQHPV